MKWVQLKKYFVRFFQIKCDLCKKPDPEYVIISTEAGLNICEGCAKK